MTRTQPDDGGTATGPGSAAPPEGPATTETRPGSPGDARALVTGASFVGQPAKVMRIGTMVKQLLEEVRSAPLDEAARTRLAEVHDRSLRELEDGLAPELVAELRRISLPFSDDVSPSESELRVAQAQLVGWLEGLFHGLQTALVAQQMAGQLQAGHGPGGPGGPVRRALPPGAVIRSGGPGPGPGGDEGDPAAPEERHPGQYL